MRLKEILFVLPIFVLNCGGVSINFKHLDTSDNEISPRTNCWVSKPGTANGEATLFQEGWAYGGACGFKNANTKHAEGYFVAVGGKDWNNGYGCGACVQLTYQGRSVIVNAVDRCGGCSDGWFDMGGPAWYDLTNNAPPGHIHAVESKWIECPSTLTGGKNLHIFVKDGSHAWDTRFQPHNHEAPVTGMSIRIAGKWIAMKKCENFMFCKPSGYILNGANTNYALRVHSEHVNVDVEMSSIPQGQYVDTGKNNGPCKAGGSAAPPPDNVAQPNPPPPAPVKPEPAPVPTPAPAPTEVPAAGNCAVDGLFPDPDDCSGFIKCAQGNPHKGSCGTLQFNTATWNCDMPGNTNCGTRPKSYYEKASSIWNQVYSTVEDYLNTSVDQIPNYQDVQTYISGFNLY